MRRSRLRYPAGSGHRPLSPSTLAAAAPRFSLRRIYAAAAACQSRPASPPGSFCRARASASRRFRRMRARMTGPTGCDSPRYAAATLSTPTTSSKCTRRTALRAGLPATRQACDVRHLPLMRSRARPHPQVSRRPRDIRSCEHDDLALRRAGSATSLPHLLFRASERVNENVEIKLYVNCMEKRVNKHI